MFISSVSNRLGSPFTNLWSKVVCVTAVLALSFYQGDALDCHQCTSLLNPKCGDPFDKNLKPTQCTINILDLISAISSMLGPDSKPPDNFDDVSSTVCYKAVVKRDSGDDQKVVFRGCCPTGQFSMCNYLKSPNVSFCDTCVSDGCNGASGVSPNSLLALLAVAVTALLVRL
ncbi:hypothetical protein J6590_086341 [Homalodisca vitripennis]|nr:hypothetical protein J6590_086341 [Homalodisca vitripennis]